MPRGGVCGAAIVTERRDGRRLAERAGIVAVYRWHARRGTAAGMPARNVAAEAGGGARGSPLRDAEQKTKSTRAPVEAQQEGRRD